MLLTRIACTMFASLLVAGAGMVFGQDYPNQTIRIITAAAGGGADFTARLIAQGLSASLGQPVAVDNRTGVLSSEAVSKAPPDGYTMLLAANVLWISPLFGKVPYDAVRDFSPITLVASSPNILAVHPSLPVNSVKALIALAKARPGELNYASAGPASGSHLAGELFKSLAGVNIVHIPFKGAGPAMIGLLGGQIQLIFASAPSAAPNMKSGKMRALAVTGAEPSALVPGLPTVAASGLPGYEAVQIYAMLAPAKTPVAIINRLNQDVVRFLGRADVKERFLNAGAETVGNSPERLSATMMSEMARLGKVIKDAGIRIE